MADYKLTEDQLEKLESLGIKEIDEKEARKQLLKKLEEFEITQVDEDPIEDLIAILEAFIAIEEEKPAKKVKKVSKVEEDSIEEDEDGVVDPTPEIIEQDVPAKPKKSKLPPPVVNKKEITKVKKEDSVDPISGKKIKFDGNNSYHVEYVNKIFKFLEQRGIKINVRGRLVKFTLANSDSGRGLFTVENISLLDGEILNADVMFTSLNLFKGVNKEDFLAEHLPEEFIDKISVIEHCGLYKLSKVSGEQFKELFTKEFTSIFVEKVKSLDKKMRKNRERMIEEFEKDK